MTRFERAVIWLLLRIVRSVCDWHTFQRAVLRTKSILNEPRQTRFGQQDAEQWTDDLVHGEAWRREADAITGELR